ncbi:MULTISPECIES: WxL domain-containing protein [Lactococcus]|uniref:WxL domain-containing protein n=1 Tax=Lactococcus petauri TaxID=1940789 RepID=A0AAJ2MLW7_9LACT|nr:MULTISPECIES: WxL domain-containing protein [Lactococcus]MCH1713422.1 WxL domain-containing protein [Lactococcus petauri]MDT2526868.1 WxL domain-containing protein [Lactococcus petauri]MDT2541413.1 WxL domain-containing protein [Lactococcus petauri]MDT2558100.1 WxL domain-containing protein [Lactococcus petauri]MDT2560230.1 WxL domain-containing protein [Lactococcus petauri]
MKTFIVMLLLLSSVQLTELGEAEEAKVNYGNDAAIQYSTGEFSIDFVSSLDFGTNKISNQNQVYFAQAQRYYKSTLVTPNFIQITDNRGTLKGWTLKVYEKEQFKAEEYSQYQELKGAALSFHKPILVTNNNAQQPQAYEVRNLVPGVETLVAQAKVGEGVGTWIIRWGNKEDLFSRRFSIGAKEIQKYFTSSVSLYVPGDTPKEATTYRTNLTWILSELPDNQ